MVYTCHYAHTHTHCVWLHTAMHYHCNKNITIITTMCSLVRFRDTHLNDSNVNNHNKNMTIIATMCYYYYNNYNKNMTIIAMMYFYNNKNMTMLATMCYYYNENMTIITIMYKNQKNIITLYNNNITIITTIYNNNNNKYNYYYNHVKERKIKLLRNDPRT
jgi:hypothetical protein